MIDDFDDFESLRLLISVQQLLILIPRTPNRTGLPESGNNDCELRKVISLSLTLLDFISSEPKCDVLPILLHCHVQ